MYKALVIGCGNIGALYDFENEEILTHAKALDNDSRFTFSVFDIDKSLATKISQRYNCAIIEEINSHSLQEFDCVSICTPTDTHYQYILQVMESGVGMILCEKPISYMEDELNKVSMKYEEAHSKILVNYMRRFQPAYKTLRERIRKINITEHITNISIRYQRGFLNNCSHAFDTIEYLTGSELELQNLSKSGLANDHFDNDPTVSFHASCNGVNVDILGLTNVKFSHFEIDIYFQYHKISLRNSGQIIEIHKADTGSRYLLPLKIQERYTQTNCLKDHMKHVIDQAHQLLVGETIEDNFMRSVNLNQRLLHYLK